MSDEELEKAISEFEIFAKGEDPLFVAIMQMWSSALSFNDVGVG